MKFILVCSTLLFSIFANAMTVYRPNELSYGADRTGNRYVCRITSAFGVECNGDAKFKGSDLDNFKARQEYGSRTDFASIDLPEPVKALSTGPSQIVVVLESGRVMSWGSNSAYALGRDTESKKCREMAKVTGDLCSNVPGYVDLPEAALTVAVSGPYTCALLSKSKSVWCWGDVRDKRNSWKGRDNVISSVAFLASSSFLFAPRKLNISGEPITIEGDSTGIYTLMKSGDVYHSPCSRNCQVEMPMPVRMLSAGAADEPLCFLLEDGEFKCQGSGDPSLPQRLALEKEQGLGSFNWSLVASYSLSQMGDNLYSTSPAGIFTRRAAMYFDKNLARETIQITMGQLYFWNVISILVQSQTSDVIQKRYFLMLKTSLDRANKSLGVEKGIMDMPRSNETKTIGLNLLELAIDSCKGETTELEPIRNLQMNIGRVLAKPTEWDTLKQTWAQSGSLFQALAAQSSTRDMLELMRQVSEHLGLTQEWSLNGFGK